MSYNGGLRLPTETELIENVGLIADRIVAACVSDGDEYDRDTRILLERALIVAAEAQQRLAEQSQRIATLETLSFKDELTGLYNRRAFNEHFARTLAIADRHGTTGVLAFIDLDDFKGINDDFGHLAGDAVLRHMGELLTRNVRATDFIARLGGDEFAAILVHTNANGGRQRAAALKRLVNGTPVRHGKHRIAIRASFGVAPFDPGDDAEVVLARADEKMYANKRARAATTPSPLRQTA